MWYTLEINTVLNVSYMLIKIFLKKGERRLYCLFLNKISLKGCKRKLIALIVSEEKKVEWGQREED